MNVPISKTRIATAKRAAMEVYERTQCTGTGCCGDINGALDTLARELGAAVRAAYAFADEIEGDGGPSLLAVRLRKRLDQALSVTGTTHA